MVDNRCQDKSTKMETVQSLWHIGKNKSEIQVDQIVKKRDLIRVETKFSMISMGTERMVALGQAPVEMHEKMKVPYGAGNFKLPIKYGYSLVGMTPDKRRVHLLHPHQNVCLVAENDLYEIPNELPFKRAALISNMETIVNAMWDAQVQEGESILIIGFGNIGALLALSLRKSGNSNIIVFDLNKSKMEMARHLGFETLASNLHNYDVVFHSSASQEGLQHAINRCNMEGKIIELSWYGNRQINLTLGKDFHYKRLSIISSQVSKIPKRVEKLYDYSARKGIVCDYLLDEVYDNLITHMVPFYTSPLFFEDVRKANVGDHMICLIEY